MKTRHLAPNAPAPPAPSRGNHQEIERRFLVAELPAGLEEAQPSEFIAQGYLAVTDAGVEIRVRRRGEHCALTVKQGEGLKRLEIELPLSAPDFETLWPLTAGRRLFKRRYQQPCGGWTAELDVYEGRLAGLRVAEIEFSDEAASRAFHPPAWFGREITDEPAFRNAALAGGGSQAPTGG